MGVTYLQQLGKRYQATARLRRELAEVAGDLQHAAKQAIFAAQRGEVKQAQLLLHQARGLLQHGQAMCRKVEELVSLGSFRAAQEEYAEAYLFVNYLGKGRLVRVPGITAAPEVYLGGVSDMVGELVRYAVRLATEHQTQAVGKVVAFATDVVKELAAMNLTGSLRSKFDQAKQHLRRLEDIRYDLSVKRHVPDR